MEQRIVEAQLIRTIERMNALILFRTSDATGQEEWFTLRQLNSVGWRVVQFGTFSDPIGRVPYTYALIEDTVAPERPL